MFTTVAVPSSPNGLAPADPSLLSVTDAACIDRRAYANAEGIFSLCEHGFARMRLRAAAIRDGRQVPVRLLGEQHVLEDLGWIPTVEDWLSQITVQKWMLRSAFRPTRNPGAQAPSTAERSA